MKSPAYLPAWIKPDEPLATHTSLRIGGNARYYCEVGDLEALLGALDWARRTGLPVYPLAGGSNILVADDGVDGLVVRVKAGDWRLETWSGQGDEGTGGQGDKGTEEAGLKSQASSLSVLEFAADGSRVRAGSGIPTGILVCEAAKRGLAGVEFLAGIPGLVGGAVASNAGGRFGRLDAALVSFSGVRLDAGDSEVYELTTSRDAQEFFVVSAELRLSPDAEAEARRDEVLEYRRRTQPQDALTAGCIFRNPGHRLESGDFIEDDRASGTGGSPHPPLSRRKRDKEASRSTCRIGYVAANRCDAAASDLQPPASSLSAGELIERAGFKGKTRGGARVSEKHANWIINTGKATALDVASLAVEIVEAVRGQFGVQLAFEIDLWGESLEEFLMRRGYLQVWG